MGKCRYDNEPKPDYKLVNWQELTADLLLALHVCQPAIYNFPVSIINSGMHFMFFIKFKTIRASIGSKLLKSYMKFLVTKGRLTLERHLLLPSYRLLVCHLTPVLAFFQSQAIFHLHHQTRFR